MKAPEYPLNSLLHPYYLFLFEDEGFLFFFHLLLVEKLNSFHMCFLRLFGFVVDVVVDVVVVVVVVVVVLFGSIGGVGELKGKEE